MHASSDDPMRGVEIVELKVDFAAATPVAAVQPRSRQERSSQQGSYPRPPPKSEQLKDRLTTTVLPVSTRGAQTSRAQRSSDPGEYWRGVRLSKSGTRSSGGSKGGSVRPSLVVSTVTFEDLLRSFDVRAARCTGSRDYDKLIAMIEASSGSTEAFNATVTASMLRAQRVSNSSSLEADRTAAVAHSESTLMAKGNPARSSRASLLLQLGRSPNVGARNKPADASV